MRARALIVVVLLVSYGAVGARQPAVRVGVPLPVRAERIAEALGIASIDRSQFVLDIIRTFFAVGLPEGDQRQRANLKELLLQPRAGKGEEVPLPLDASIWRETLLARQVPDNDLIETILSDRTASLLYHGLFGLDDDTLAWLGPERDTLRVLARHSGAFSAFGTSLRVQAGKVIVPGGAEAEPIWQAIVGADPNKPAAFVRKLFEDEGGYKAWFYDSLAQLDPARLRFALGLWLPQTARIERARSLFDVFEHSGASLPTAKSDRLGRRKSNRPTPTPRLWMPRGSWDACIALHSTWGDGGSIRFCLDNVSSPNCGHSTLPH
jgi:hypothetical protein